MTSHFLKSCLKCHITCGAKSEKCALENLMSINLSRMRHTENKDINDTIQAGNPQQVPITAGPEHIK